MDIEQFEVTDKLYTAQAKMHLLLVAFGDELAADEGYKVHRGIDAIHWYLVTHYNWLPSVVKSLNYEDLQFLMAERLKGWVLPKHLQG